MGPLLVQAVVGGFVDFAVGSAMEPWAVSQNNSCAFSWCGTPIHFTLIDRVIIHLVWQGSFNIDFPDRVRLLDWLYPPLPIYNIIYIYYGILRCTAKNQHEHAASEFLDQPRAVEHSIQGFHLEFDVTCTRNEVMKHCQLFIGIHWWCIHMYSCIHWFIK